MYSKSYWVKLFFFCALLFVETFALAKIINDFVSSKRYFTIDILTAIYVVILMFLMMHTYALTIGSWGSLWHRIYPSLAVILGLFIALINIDVYYLAGICLVTFILLIHDGYRAYKLNSILLKFEPGLVFHTISRGLMFIISILAGVLVIAHSNSNNQLNIGRSVADLAGKPLKTIVGNQLTDEIQKQTMYFGGSLPEDQIQNVLEQYGIPAESTPISEFMKLENSEININFNEILEHQINAYLEPYKEFINPLMAVLVFALFQFYAGIALVLFTLTARPVFWIARSSRLFNVERFTVEKEELRF